MNGPDLGDDAYADVPDQMKAVKRWLLWKSVPAPEGKPKKVPFYTNGRARGPKLDCPDDWDRLVTFDEALVALRAGDYAGPGFALGPDGTGNCWQGIDLDHIADHFGLEFVAEDLPGYTDESPSGLGVHAVGYGRPFPTLGANGTGIEAYAQGRFLTVTGSKVGLGKVTCLADFVRDELVPRHRRDEPTPTPSDDQGPLSLSLLEADLREALRFVPADDRALWVKLGHALKTLGDVGYDVWLEWSQKSSKYEAKAAEVAWEGFKPVRIGHRAVFTEARRHGWNGPSNSGASHRPDGAAPAVGSQSDPAGDAAPGFSEEALALEFAARHAQDLRYVPIWGRWMVFDGKRWSTDKRLSATQKARHLVREVALQMEKERDARRMASASTVAGVERLARADARLATPEDIWDADPWLLNTPGGVVDLRTGVVRPHSPGDYMTKMTAVAPEGDCPLWLAFIERITGGDVDLATFLQRMAGYMLTGDVSLQLLFFAHGTGANGKSVFVNTLANILGDYHCAATIETFTATSYDRHPAEVAYLNGARLVTCVETEQGRRWQESRIKALTGGDKISARFMRQDPFEFTPQFKLLIAGNHKPSLRSVDEAIRRRFKLIPFSVTIPPKKRDTKLPEKLKAEYGGILQWALDGCMAWQRHGLGVPDAVDQATDEYLAAEDAIGAWLAECCELSPNYRTPTRELFVSWKTWAEGAGEAFESEKTFVQLLGNRGFDTYRTKDARGFRGLRLLAG